MSPSGVVLSVRQPWAWCLISLPLEVRKPVENRQRKDAGMPDICRHRGPLLIHASAGCTKREYEDARCWVGFEVGERVEQMIPPLADLGRGGIIGSVKAIACLLPAGSISTRGETAEVRRALGRNGTRWHVRGQYGLVVADAEPLPFFPCKGSLGLWRLP